MKTKIYLAIALLLHMNAFSQINITVNTASGNKAISKYIYGVNSTGAISGADATNQANEAAAKITARRWGGDRATPYNWENNISTQGYYSSATDGENDDWLPSLYGINSCTGNTNGGTCTPNLILKKFHQNSINQGAYSLLTLPMSGYVANDITAPNAAATAPSANFNAISFAKTGAPASWQTIPTLGDGKVYIDEQLHELITYCNNNNIALPNGYCLDNEPTIWDLTLKNVHPAVPTCAEIITKSINLAKLIKAQQPGAETFGASHMNFASYLDGNAYARANGWGVYNNVAPDFYQNFNQAFLGEMKKESVAFGSRLLDVLDVHYYPAINNGTNDVDNSLSDAATRRMRMQAPRSFDDNSFIENSWVSAAIGNVPINYLNRLQTDITNRYPGTKLSMSEYRFGGNADVSGGIALVDILGRFAKNGVYQAHYFDPVTNYVAAAFKLYRNFDGNGGSFGDTYVDASTNEVPVNTTVATDGFNNERKMEVYAATESTDATRLHLIVLNKSIAAITSTITITSATTFDKYDVYAFDASGSTIQHIATNVSIAGNTLNNLNVPALSALHIVLVKTTATPPPALFNKYIAQPYGLDNTVRFFEKNNVNLNNPAGVINVGNFVNGVLIDGNKMFVASDNVYYYNTGSFPISHTKGTVNTGTTINTGFIIGMATEPGTHNLFVTRNNNQISYYTAASNYTSSVDISIPGCCVPSIIANLAFDASGNLWATAFDGDNSGGQAALWCFTKASNFANMYILGCPGGQTATAANSLDNAQHNSLYLFSQPEGITADAAGNIWVANNNDHHPVPDNAAGTLTKISKTWLDNNVYNAAPASPSIIADPSAGATIYYIPGAKLGGVALDGDTLYVNDQGQNQGNDILTSGKVWKWNTTTAFNTTNFAGCGVTTTYPGNGTMALTNASFLPINLAHDFDLSSATITAAQDLLSSPFNNRLLCNINPAGASPVAGLVSARCTIDATVQATANGDKYVQRHYDIYPFVNEATATAKITLYYLNSEFQAYNTTVGGAHLQLPDATISTTANTANVHITQYHGQSTTFLPGSYTNPGTAVDVTPNSVNWDPYMQCWAVEINVTGFSGFFAKAGPGILPLRLLSFNGTAKDKYNELHWKTVDETNTKTFSIERSNDGSSFSGIGNVATQGAGNNSYSFSDLQPLSGNNFYRLKMVDNDGRFTYSNIIKLSNTGSTNQPSTIFPNPTSGVATLTIGDKNLINSNALLIDISGKQLQSIKITGNTQTIDLSKYPSGVYLIRLSSGEVMKLVKQ